MKLSSFRWLVNRRSDHVVRRGDHARFIADAAVLGWRAAALSMQDSEPDFFQYVGDERSADWRFLLPELRRDAVLIVGGALSPVPLILAGMFRRAVVVAPVDEWAFLDARARGEGIGNIEATGRLTSPAAREPFDLVAILRPSPGSRATAPVRRAAEAQARVAPGGALYVEVPHGALSCPPAILRRQLWRSGFTRVQLYWPKPTFSGCELLLPLDDCRLQRFYLDQVYFAMGIRRRLLRQMLRVTAGLRMFHLIVPAYSVLATRSPDRDTCYRSSRHT